MILDAKSGARGVLVNVATGERIPFAKWANTETGEWVAWAATPDGKAIAMPPRLVKGQCRLSFVASDAPAIRAPKPVPSAAAQAAEIRRIAPDFVRDWKEIVAVPGVECDEPGCHRLADYETADHHEVEPETDQHGTQWRRAVVTATHRWCSWHFRSPVATSVRGVESERETAVRPD